ncbi:MAG: beta-galactosidase family protein [Phycisphaerae bacterium]|jgi:hypothetical protein
MPTVSFDDRSFLVDGKPVWLVSGAIHYFRTPAALWRDRLLKAKRAGLNCVETYVAWNFHEPVEGQWQFTGDHDVAAFVRTAGELGLYVILRPGPYICAEWDNGGLPGWLSTKPGMGYRTSNAAFTHYYDKYFRQLLPRLADMQVTRGGNIILIQNENEYQATAMPDRLNYLQFITQLFRRSGFDIPVINCNMFSDPPLPESIECVNGWDRVVGHLKRMRLRQSGKPLLVTEFWGGWFDRWGGPHERRDARETARRALEILGCGAQINYYMFHGGTNFAFWGARLESAPDAYQTTSYDFDAPLAEGGGLTEKYYLTRLVNMLANHMGPYLATCAMTDPPVTAMDVSDVLNIAGPAGRWAVVTNNGRGEITTATVALPNGRGLPVSLEPIGAVAIPVNVTLNPEHKLDYANVMPLGFFGGKYLVLHGPAGWEARVSVNGVELKAPIPAGNEPKVIEHQGLAVILVTSDLAMRTWFVEQTLVFGPRYVGENLEEVDAAGANQYALLSLDEGKLTHRKAKPTSPVPAAPKMGDWKRVSVCREPVADDLTWQKIDRPRSMEQLGVPGGYIWHRIELQSPSSARKHLFLPQCEDRATLYLNGALLGTWGRGEGASRQPMAVHLKNGANVLTLLVDNLGRCKIEPGLGESKGLMGHIYDAQPLPPVRFKLSPVESFPRRIIPRQMLHVLPELERQKCHEAEGVFTLKKVAPVHLSFTDVPGAVAITCNERSVGFFKPTENNYGDVTLGPELKKGRNVIKLLLWGQPAPQVLEKFRFHVLEESLTQHAAWSYRPWTLPAPGGHVVGKDQPAWYVSHFACQERNVPLFLHIVAARKGQMYLNGHNLGRFWTLGPQELYYLPACWLKDNNELMIFEEHGEIPRRSRLEFRPQGPYRP